MEVLSLIGLFFVILLVLSLLWSLTSSCSSSTAARQGTARAANKAVSLANAMGKQPPQDPFVLAILPLPIPMTVEKKRLTTIAEKPIFSILRQAFRKPFRAYDLVTIDNRDSSILRDIVFLARGLSSMETVVMVTSCPAESDEWKAIVSEPWVVWNPSDSYLDREHGPWVKAKYVAEELHGCASSLIPLLLGIPGYEASLRREEELRENYAEVRSFEVKQQTDVVDACILKAMYPTLNVSFASDTEELIGVTFLKLHVLI